ncbi:MAG: cob(I)yrinic acid a,c-diamide adenosyltransferase [Desulfuromonadales bacterium]|nr:cob(I)yrinic acid a,c-diamide adenosyltransferase [Desulfuromonadales bacterium]
MQKGLLHIYTGDGKGKTTAATGLAVRALGRGQKVLFAHFLKPAEPKSGEDLLFSRLDNIHLLTAGVGVIASKATREEIVASVETTFVEICRLVAAESFDLVILDEMNLVLHKGYLSLAEMEKFIDARPVGLNLVLTGRHAPAPIRALADLVTVMQKEKHPYDRGIAAREGLEY